MRVRRLTIQNFRGISHGIVDFAGHTLLVGGNNVGKSTVCEALDLILGPERLYRRPVVDEHDFYSGLYLDSEDAPIEIRICATLVDLSEEALRRFHNHLRRINIVTGEFIDDTSGGLSAADGEDTSWGLPIIFIGRYDEKEDDFIGNTFFDHPQGETNQDEDDEIALGQGRTIFGRTHKRLCGFVYLRTLRTGSRALSLQRGSLLDTVLKVGGAGAAQMWLDTLVRLRTLDPAIGEIEQLKQIREELQARMGQFVNLANGSEATAFFASDLTREHLREVVRLFIATQPGNHLVPFGRLGTGSINLLVFALLTFIAELKGKQSVIFAMEEPEIALPPHTQRRVTRFVLTEMGQSVVTSHSPYVIEQFGPEQVLMLNRDVAGTLESQRIDTNEVRPKNYHSERRQFAEAILSRAVLVVEGATESSLFPVASTVMEEALGPHSYSHFDLAGLTVFNAGGDGSIPRYGQIFTSLGKLAFGFYDKQDTPPSADTVAKLNCFTMSWESPEKGIESLLVKESPIEVVKRFLCEVSSRADYPTEIGPSDLTADEVDIRTHAVEVLRHRKGDATGYAAIFIGQCQSEQDLPRTIRMILEEIQNALTPRPDSIAETEAEVADLPE
jgi:putative ATP-dependent endonuclease of the OLD family